MGTSAEPVEVGKGASQLPQEGEHQLAGNRFVNVPVVGDELPEVSTAAVCDNKDRIVIHKHLVVFENVWVKEVKKSG